MYVKLNATHYHFYYVAFYISIMEIISVVNHKGGVGKTTLCSNLAQALAIVGKKVLCIDNDSQHSLSNRLGVPVSETTIRELYRGEYESYDSFLRSAVVESIVPGLHCITSTLSLCNGDITDVMVLHNLIHDSFIADYYDYVFIDNHPGLDNLQRASIAASTRLIVPVLMKQQSMEGLSEMMTLLGSFNVPHDRITIIPNIMENIKDQKIMYGALQQLYPMNMPGNLLIVPLDRTIEVVEREQKILFLDRLQTSNAVKAFVHIITQLFPELGINDDQALLLMKEARKEHRSALARENFKKQRENNESE